MMLKDMAQGIALKGLDLHNEISFLRDEQMQEIILELLSNSKGAIFE